MSARGGKLFNTAVRLPRAVLKVACWILAAGVIGALAILRTFPSFATLHMLMINKSLRATSKSLSRYRESQG